MSTSTYSEFKNNVRVSSPQALSDVIDSNELQLILTPKNGKIKEQQNYILRVNKQDDTKIFSIYIALPKHVQFKPVTGKYNYRQAVWFASAGDPDVVEWSTGFDRFLEILLEKLRPLVNEEYNLVASPIMKRDTSSISFGLDPKKQCDLERLNEARGSIIYGGIEGIYMYKNEERKTIYVGFNWQLFETPVATVKEKATGKRRQPEPVTETDGDAEGASD